MLTSDELEHKEYLEHAIATMQDQLNSLRARERKNKRFRVKLFFKYIWRAKKVMWNKSFGSIIRYLWSQSKYNAIWDGVEWWHRY